MTIPKSNVRKSNPRFNFSDLFGSVNRVNLEVPNAMISNIPFGIVIQTELKKYVPYHEDIFYLKSWSGTLCPIKTCLGTF